MYARNRSKSQLGIVIHAANAPNTSDIAQVCCVGYRGPLVTLCRVAAQSKHHNVAIGHTYGHLSVVVQGAHAVHTFWHFNSLEKLKRELVVDKDPAISAPNEQTIDSHDGAVHLTPLNV